MYTKQDKDSFAGADTRSWKGVCVGGGGESV